MTCSWDRVLMLERDQHLYKINLKKTYVLRFNLFGLMDPKKLGLIFFITSK